MDKNIFYDCLMTPNSKKASQASVLSYYSPSPIKSSY